MTLSCEIMGWKIWQLVLEDEAPVYSSYTKEQYQMLSCQAGPQSLRTLTRVLANFTPNMKLEGGFQATTECQWENKYSSQEDL